MSKYSLRAGVASCRPLYRSTPHDRADHPGHGPVRALRRRRRRLPHHRARRPVDVARRPEVGRPHPARALPRAPPGGRLVHRRPQALRRRRLRPGPLARVPAVAPEAAVGGLRAGGRRQGAPRLPRRGRRLLPGDVPEHPRVPQPRVPREHAARARHRMRAGLQRLARRVVLRRLAAADPDDDAAVLGHRRVGRGDEAGLRPRPQGCAVRRPLRQGRAAPPRRRRVGAGARSGPGDGAGHELPRRASSRLPTTSRARSTSRRRWTSRGRAHSCSSATPRTSPRSC